MFVRPDLNLLILKANYLVKEESNQMAVSAAEESNRVAEESNRVKMFVNNKLFPQFPIKLNKLKLRHL